MPLQQGHIGTGMRQQRPGGQPAETAAEDDMVEVEADRSSRLGQIFDLRF